MDKRRGKRRKRKLDESKSTTLSIPELLEKEHGPNFVMDSLPPETRATLAAFAAPGAPADKIPLAAGDSLAERVRHPSHMGTLAEVEYPNFRELEASAPTTWAAHRANSAKWQAELEANIVSGRKAFVSGNLGVLLDTLINCGHRDGCLFGFLSEHPDHWVAIPRWTLSALTVLAAETLPGIRAQQRGKHAKWYAGWKQDQIDYARWKAVRELREQGVPFTDGKVYEAARWGLDPDGAPGVDAVRRSYLLVQKRMKTQPSRYFHLDYGRAMNPQD